MSVLVDIANGMIEVRVVNLAECLVAIEWRSSWKKTKMHYVITPKQGEGNMSREKLTFVVFLIHQLAEAWGQSPSQVYERLVEKHILDEYIIRHYDTLHSLGREYLIDDITGFMKERAG